MKKGYTPQEWQELRKQSSSYFQDAITTLTPFAGLTANALGHLSDEWITWKEDYVRIDVPETAPCSSWKLASCGGPDGNNLPHLIEREGPCSFCRNNGETDEFDNHWNGEVQRYTAILHRDLCKPAIDFLSMVFDTHGRPEFGGHPRSLYREADRLTDDSGKKASSYKKLLKTGPVIYAHYGLKSEDIADLTMYSESTIEHIIASTPQVNVSNPGSQKFLKILSKAEPVTIKQLSDKLDVKRNTVQRRISHLADEERVTSAHTDTESPQKWETTVHWSTPFRCDCCEFETHSLQGIRQHRSTHQD
jgi:hypothetical protein